jgi:16S rRNA (guanine966-N2)-methyltransferase
MRIIAGKYRSRPLHSLRGVDIRPTSDRLRETLFNILTAGNPAALENTVWLDLFAGTGAVGIEALSRGAGHIYFVDNSRDAIALINKNLSTLNVTSGFALMAQDVLHGLAQMERQHIEADVIFLDPPYRMNNAYSGTLAKLAESPIIKPATFVIAEHDKKFDPGPDFAPLHRIRLLTQGDASLSFYRQ